MTADLARHANQIRRNAIAEAVDRLHYACMMTQWFIVKCERCDNEYATIEPISVSCKRCKCAISDGPERPS